MKRKDLLIHIGGVFRCCVESAAQWVEEEPEAEAIEGARLICRYCKQPDGMVIDGKVIRWNRGGAADA